MGKYRLRNATVDAYQYTGPAMNNAIVSVLGIDYCVAATATRPALIYITAEKLWRELRPTMWLLLFPEGVRLMGNRDFVLTYRNVDGEGVVLPPIDPGPDVYP